MSRILTMIAVGLMHCQSYAHAQNGALFLSGVEQQQKNPIRAGLTGRAACLRAIDGEGVEIWFYRPGGRLHNPLHRTFSGCGHVLR